MAKVHSVGSRAFRISWPRLAGPPKEGCAPNCHRTKVKDGHLGERFRKLLAVLFAFFTLCLPCGGLQIPSSGTVPFIFEGNRVYAELALVRPDGTLHRVLAFVDLGSPSMILSEALFKELRLDQEKSLIFKIGDMPVRVDSRVISDTWLPYSIGR